MTIGEPRTERRPLLRVFRVHRRLEARLIQLIYVIVGVALGVSVPLITVGKQLNSRDVVTMLSGAAAGLLTVGSVVYALLFLVVQFAANSQSPRLNLFRDQPLVWHTLGLVLGTLIYFLTCAMVAGDEATTTVLVPASAAALLLLVIVLGGNLQMAAFRSVQLSPVLDTITSRTREVIDALYPDPYRATPSALPTAPDEVTAVSWPGGHGVMRQIDLPRLIRLGRTSGTIIRLRLMPGDFVHHHDTVAEIWGRAAGVDPKELLSCLDVGIDRTHVQDPLLGFRLLVDIAMRAMSRINDPATAVQAIEYIYTLLAALLGRDLAIGVVAGDTGATRVVFDAVDWTTFLAAGTDEIADADMHPMVRQRLHLMLQQLLVVAPDDRQPPIRTRLARLDPDTEA